MYFKRFLAVFASIAFVVTACNRNAAVLSYTNAKDEVPQLGNLQFRFDQGMVADSLLNVWDSTDYISFEPAIRGKYRWETPDQLVFSPAEPLNPATDYTARIKSSVLRFSKYDKVSGGDDIKFHTPALQLESSQVIWIGESSTTASPQLDLFFNYKINPADLKELLQIDVDGKKQEFSLLTVSPDSKISVRLNGVKSSDNDYSSKITIGKGLKPEGGKNSTAEALSSAVTIPSPYSLIVQNLETEHDGTDGFVHVVTSQQLSEENLKSHIKIDPEVSFSVSTNESGFTIRSSQFSVDKSYTLIISKGLRGKIGGVLKEEYNGSIAFGELEPGITFTNNKAVYLSKKGAKNMEVRITSVEKVKIVISKIYENNLLMAQRYGYYPQESGNPGYDDYEGEYGGDSYTSASLGDVIYEKVIDTRSLPKSGGGRLLNFSQFEDRLPDFNGVYHVVIRSETDYWVRDSRFISLSDIGLIAKQGEDKIVVFANSIKTADPVNGVTISVYAANNQLIGTGATDADGVASIAYSKKEFSGFKPAMIIAKTADDFNYLPFNNTRVNTSRFAVGGKRNNSSGLDAFVYAERDIYRPGERVNFSVIIRDREWHSPGEIPLKMKFLMPNGKELKTFRKNLNDEGAVEGNVDIATSAITGSYTLEVYTSNDVLLASKNFSIEEFVPDRIRVNAKLSATALKPGQSSQLSINAMNFFGPPAANRNYETEIQVKQKSFSPEKFSNYNFSLANQNTFFDKQVKEGKTDAEGNAVETYEVPDTYQHMGALQTNFYTTVFDETGRPVSRMVSADVYTQDVFYGIKYDWMYYFPLNQTAKFDLVSVNKEGSVVNSTAKVQVIKHEYRTVLSKSGSYFRYESQKQDKMMTEVQLNVGNNTSFSYVPRSPGDYELRVYIPGANSYVSRSFYSYGSWGGDNNSFEVNNEGNVDITLDKKSYESGETVKALFKTPFSGRMLVTMETDHLISHQYVTVNDRSASLDLKLTGEHVPNVYITATLIKPHEMSDIPLTVAHGFQNVSVEEKSREIPVTIDAQKTVRSKTHQKIKVKGAPGSYVTLSAVDNGVLQVSDFKTPDPYNYFYQQKALQVSAYDLYPLLFAEVRARSSSTGGDGELSMDRRVNPMPAKRIKVVSYWSGIKKTDGSGNAEFEIDIPQFSGEIRLMAVSYKGQRFGSGENTMTVADPIVLSTALPRFLSPGDTVNVPVTLSNTTDKSTNVSATIKVEGGLKVVGSATESIPVSAKSEGRASFRIIADPVIGIGKVKILANGAGEKFEDETEISIRPASTLQKRTGSGVIAGGSSQTVNVGMRDFIPGSSNYNFVVSRSPVLELGEQLRYLVQYPYGCTEQTVSAAFPQLYYGDMVDLMQLNAKEKTNANSNILEAIRKIKMRQLYTGAVTLWDGGGKEDWWSTIYSAHFLLEARKAGFDVDNSLIETMLNYINHRLKNRELITYYYNRDQQKKIAPKEVAYGLYVLALAGRTNIPAMNYYKSNPAVLALDSRYLLSAAYAAAGDKKSFTAILPGSFAGEESVTQTGGSYYSAVRDEAIALNALVDVDPGNKQIPVMAKHVGQQLKSRSWLSTQERAFSFLALGKLARSANSSTVTAEIKVDGKTVAKVEGGQWRGDKAALKGTNVQVVTKGTGNLYFFWEAEGISATGDYVEEDNFLKVRKRFFDRFGTPVSGNTFRQNDLVIIGITLEKTYSGSVENIVITDLLPAGFEIENPRTKEIPGMDWIKDASTPTSIDVRDDRLHLFVDAYNNKQTYYYAVRAVSPGQYKMGPVSADAMYNGEYHSYNGAGVIRIVQ
ncbi:MG2 domain-containing protein [Terrimonas sp. NA20]|uniref:MG2 domain-containing protein n=1 Tax=Terrimonas ginsenosidimutans TaxID=2908004 RepID=A0ABS9KPF3_9BACT|nr:MG2 domain-containing protein [Terrimonas ginsenosidimutans]MCG2614210.1 MG2 domain-containing protein [Terrimonas ginsenosidimutans]